MSFVRDIQERTPSSSSAPPTPPTSATGFPAIPHRSQRISAFKRARQEAKGGPKALASNEPPIVRSTFEGSWGSSTLAWMNAKDRLPGPPATDVAGILASVQEENETKVNGMSERDRLEELEELEHQIPKSVLDMLRARLLKKQEVEKEDGEDTSEEEPEEDEKQDGGPAEVRFPRLMQESQAKILDPERELHDSGSDSVRERGGTFESPKSDANRSELIHTDVRRAESTINPTVSFNPILSFERTPELHPSTTKVTFDDSRRNDPIDITQDIHDRYFPREALEQPALEWIQKPLGMEDLNEVASTGVSRFDLSGKVLTEQAARDLPVTRGLHHHGAEAGRAGYTLAEVLMLSSSTYGPQRVMMLGLLGKIMDKVGMEAMDETKLGVAMKEAKKSAFLLASGILGSKEKNVGLLREAISTLLAVLEASDPEEIANVTSLVELGSVLGRIDGLLEEPIRSSRLSAPSILQLVVCLSLLAGTSTALARSVALQVPTVMRAFVLSLTWPDLGRNAPVDWEIALTGMAILRECTERHRDLANLFAQSNIYTSLLKFLAVPPWATNVDAEEVSGYAYELVAVILTVMERITRYGLQGTLVTNFSDIFRSVGLWVQSLGAAELMASDVLLRIVTAYLALIRTWTVAGTNPHSMVNDHELIWSQLEGYAWMDEALYCLEMTWGAVTEPETSAAVVGVVTSSIDLLTAWSTAVTVNTVEPRTWMDRIRSTVVSLKIAAYASTASAKVAAGSETDLALLDSWTRLASQLNMASGMDSSWTSMYAARSISNFAAGRRLLGQHLLYGNRKDVSDWARSACLLLSQAQPGDEQESLAVIDVLLDLNWESDVQESVKHRHGLYILRPFYHCAILPSLSNMLSPHHPTGKAMKLTSSLKPDSLGRSTGGLPLRSDWMLSPLNDQLRPTVSLAFKQVPPAWEASPTEIVQAVLTIYDLLDSASGISLDRSTVIFNVMKVFMLELVVEADEEHHEAIFRDPAVSARLASVLKPLLSTSNAPAGGTLETVSESLLTPGTTFFQWYSDFHELYESVSFSHMAFSQLLLPPLAQCYPVDYRRLFWSEQTAALRTIRLRMDQIPLEHGSLRAYFHPPEQDREVLAGYLTALAKGSVSAGTHGFLYALAVWHVANAVWKEDSALCPNQVRSALSPAIWNDILRCDCAESRNEFLAGGSVMDNEAVEFRLASMDNQVSLT